MCSTSNSDVLYHQEVFYLGKQRNWKRDCFVQSTLLNISSSEITHNTCYYLSLWMPSVHMQLFQVLCFIVLISASYLILVLVIDFFGLFKIGYYISNVIFIYISNVILFPDFPLPRNPLSQSLMSLKNITEPTRTSKIYYAYL